LSEWKFTIKELTEKPELISPGHRLCAGCNHSIIVRQLSKASRGPIIATNATGCLEVATTIYPYTSWQIPWIHVAFENAAANASGIEAAIKVLQRKGKIKEKQIDVIAFAGDGGTYDIGMQALSGAVERGHDFLYVLLDNEAYMNTGIQRSGGTPHGAMTTTTPAGKVIPGKPGYKKPIADIIVAHGAPYVATVSPAYWRDLISKTRKALEIEGPAFIHAISPCPTGWFFATDKGIELAKLATETCYFPIWESINGKYSLSAPSKIFALRPDRKKAVAEFLKPQGRFRHLFRDHPHVVDEIQKSVDDRWQQLLKKCEDS
jgi:pyruvate ferredoxin oxidoreductase beta subunit